MNITQIIACVGKFYSINHRVLYHTGKVDCRQHSYIERECEIHFCVVVCRRCLKACTLERCVIGALISKKHVEVILMTRFQAYLTNDSSNVVSTC